MNYIFHPFWYNTLNNCHCSFYTEGRHVYQTFGKRDGYSSLSLPSLRLRLCGFSHTTTPCT